MSAPEASSGVAFRSTGSSNAAVGSRPAIIADITWIDSLPSTAEADERYLCVGDVAVSEESPLTDKELEEFLVDWFRPSRFLPPPERENWGRLSRRAG